MDESKFNGTAEEADSLADYIALQLEQVGLDVDTFGADEQIVGIATGELYTPPKE